MHRVIVYREHFAGKPPIFNISRSYGYGGAGKLASEGPALGS